MADVTPEQLRSPQQRSWCVSKYYKVRSFKKIQAEFSQKFPDKKRIQAWVKKFEMYGRVENLNKKSDRREVILGGIKCHSMGWDVLRRNH